MELDAYDLIIRPFVRTKLSERGISLTEIEESFFDAGDLFYKETRVQHQTKPPTYFCFGLTVEGKLLKIVFIPFHERREIILKTAYEVEEWEIPDNEN